MRMRIYSARAAGVVKGGAIAELWTAPTFWVRGVRGLAVHWNRDRGATELWRREHLS